MQCQGMARHGMACLGMPLHALACLGMLSIPVNPRTNPRSNPHTIPSIPVPSPYHPRQSPYHPRTIPANPRTIPVNPCTTTPGKYLHRSFSKSYPIKHILNCFHAKSIKVNTSIIQSYVFPCILDLGLGLEL